MLLAYVFDLDFDEKIMTPTVIYTAEEDKLEKEGVSKLMSPTHFLKEKSS
jgi:hypothetical protein